MSGTKSRGGYQAPPGPKLDNNFYRKVSKYELDKGTVDFKALYRERDRQITENGKRRKEVGGVVKAGKAKSEVLNKMLKIQELNEMRETHIADRQATAKKNQEQLSQMIAQVNHLQQTGQMQSFKLANSFLAGESQYDGKSNLNQSMMSKISRQSHKNQMAMEDGHSNRSFGKHS